MFDTRGAWYMPVTFYFPFSATNASKSWPFSWHGFRLGGETVMLPRCKANSVLPADPQSVARSAC